MRSKTHLIEFNRRRELQRRIRFVKQRMKQMPIEEAYASGKIDELPDTAPVPPDWAVAAARFGSNGMVKKIAHLEPKPGRKYLPEDFVELLGHVSAILCYVENLPKDIVEQQKEVPELASIWRPLSKQTIKGFHKLVVRLSRRYKVTGAIPDAERLAVMYERYAKGLKSFASPEGDLRGLDSKFTRIYFLIWMFWPELKHRFTAPKVHCWLKEDFEESPSDKTVEAVMTALRKEPRRLDHNPNPTV